MDHISVKRFFICLLALLLTAPAAEATVYLSLVQSYKNDLNYAYNSDEGVYTLTTTGGDPYVYAAPLSRSLTSEECMLTFEYSCTRAINSLQLYFGNDWTEARSQLCGTLKATGSEWKTMSIDLSAARENFDWGASDDELRFDFGTLSGYTIKVRNITIGAEDDTEAEAKQALSDHLGTYLQTDYGTACGIDSVNVTSTRVTIMGHTDGKGRYSLVEVPMYQDITELQDFVYEQELTDTAFTVQVLRTVTYDKSVYDRLLSRWALIDRTESTPQLMTHGRYATSVYAKSHATEMRMKSKKGLGGFWLSPNVEDLDSLGIGSVTANVVISSMISTQASTFSTPTKFTYNRTTYYIDLNAVNELDKRFLLCYKRGIPVNAILLTSRDMCPDVMKALMIHPESDGGYYGMPNLTTVAGINAYAAIVTFLADRYSKGTHGRINNWILHNEVDYGKTWTNMGDQPVRNYVDMYVKSMRLVSLIASQYDQNAWALGSYTHSWTDVSTDGPGYSTKNMLSITQQLSDAEGDFRWGLACHPYPQDLTQPEFWKNDTKSTYTQNTSFVTFRNLEVLNNWALAPANYYQGQDKRLVLLSENGTNSPSYSTRDLTLQAAGACWAWKKANALPGIDAIQWHNWADNRDEGGLRIGLHRYSDDETDPNGRKPVWYVWQAAGTDAEDSVFAPYMSTLGITSWSSIFSSYETGILAPRVATTTLPGPAIRQVYDLRGILVGNTTAGLPAGLYIIRQTDGKVRKIRIDH